MTNLGGVWERTQNVATFCIIFSFENVGSSSVSLCILIAVAVALAYTNNANANKMSIFTLFP